MSGATTFGKRVLLLAGFLLIQVACGGGGTSSDSPQSSGPSNGKITLSGHFAATSSAAGGSVTSKIALDASTVSKVIVFDTQGLYSTAPVTGGSFSIPVDVGAPVGMIFVGSTNNYLGYLSLGNGISSLPMTDVKEGVTSIDLQTLSASGDMVTPGHNPLGAELPLSSADQAAFAQCNSLFDSMVKNPDVDGNGVIDLLEGSFYRSSLAYGVTPMSSNGSYTPVIGSLAIQHFNLSVMSSDGSDSGPTTVTGPTGSGLTNAACSVTVSGSQVYYGVYSNLGSSPTPVPVAGDYVFTTSKGKTITITVPDQSDANSRIVVAVPTVTVSSGTINRIDWRYQMASSTETLSPSALIDNLIIAIDHPLGSRVYNSPGLPSSTTSHTPTNQTIPWDSSTNLDMAYTDVFGNHYVVSFTNP
jgi:hypothetical protein